MLCVILGVRIGFWRWRIKERWTEKGMAGEEDLLRGGVEGANEMKSDLYNVVHSKFYMLIVIINKLFRKLNNNR